MKKKKFDTLAWVIEMVAYIYVMYACLWTICHLISEIFAKMGVG